MKKIIFLGEHGLTQTEASHLCNIVTQIILEKQRKISSQELFEEKISVQGNSYSGNKHSCELDIALVEENILEIGRMHSLTAYLREGIKEKQQWIESVDNITFQDIPKDFYPTTEIFNFEMAEDPVNDFHLLSQSEMTQYLILEANAAHIGQYIHKAGLIDVWRNTLSTYKPVSIKRQYGTEVDEIIELKPFPQTLEIEPMFFRLQQKHREYSKQLNLLKAKINENYSKILNDAKECNIRFLNEQKVKNQILNSFKEHLRSGYSKLKIVVPEELKDLVNEIKSI